MSDIHLDGSLSGIVHPDAEAALEALRAAIAQPSGDLHDDALAAVSSDEAHEAHEANEVHSAEIEAEAGDGAESESNLPGAGSGAGVGVGLATHAQQLAMEKALSALTQLVGSNQTVLDNMNMPAVLAGLAGSFKLLVESQRRQAEMVKGLAAQLAGQAMALASVDPAFAVTYVPRSEYDALKAKYEALVASGVSGASASKRSRASASRQPTVHVDDDLAGMEEGELVLVEEKAGGRKKRSMKLEHLVHKMANRRLGVEYAVTNFDVMGTKDLPDPDSHAPSADASVNKIQEYRPDFRGDVTASNVKPYIDTVVEDVVGGWEGTMEGEDLDRKRVEEAVNVYWSRLCKRYSEQQSRLAGLVHKDELVRRKQNQYRRQQSLLARRVAGFDHSPLNVCKLRALYRTLLTVDFAAPTNERPDPKRVYTEDEWNAYRKQSGHKDAHEVVDQFWLSPSARSLLVILDVFAADQASRIKRKGRPKQPAPTFHLPPSLWDRSTLPTLRPKDAQGLPVSGAQGIILFKFHVDEMVQAEYPEWAQGLYDNPPIPEEDALLPSLPEVMGASLYASLKPRIKALRASADVQLLLPGEVLAINSGPDELPPASASALDQLESASASVPMGNTPTGPIPVSVSTEAEEELQLEDIDLGTSEFMSRNLESFVAMAAAQTSNPTWDGSSVRARKQSKRSAREVPGGAATPVAKRLRSELGGAVGHGDVEGEGAGTPAPEDEIGGDSTFLESL
ncbi:hypothetical protein EHS25_004688 [Saitozyma podzolica]|uniref:Uncharacterized protein n=1 Tax=Saitozyma podzolica TaxID=1890683 RepID=A0A427YUX0_9TREE|nr:hypothetical protein EHS25_004688 [Saitozyma podzolica]